jgi:phosphatidylglycerol:prolipoprotein diacylglycerol transferase
MITFTPDPIALQIGPVAVYWYGIAYALGLLVAYFVLVRQASRFGQDPELVGNGLIVIAAAALVGGRAYHVIDQWHLYADNPIKIFLPPYSGLGVYGGLMTGVLAFLVLVRYHRVNGWVWADIVAPALFTMQAIGRWGNFFNQELFGPPTSLPWGIAIDCAHRLSDHGAVIFPCSAYPEATTFFQPLFLYESVSGALGAIFLIWLSRRRPYPLRAGDQVLIFFIWYAIVRFLLENLRTGNWFVGGVATAQIMSILFGLGAFLVLLYRHRRPFADAPIPADGSPSPRARGGGSADVGGPRDEADDLDDLDDDEDARDRVGGERRLDGGFVDIDLDDEDDYDEDEEEDDDYDEDEEEAGRGDERALDELAGLGPENVPGVVDVVRPPGMTD